MLEFVIFVLCVLFIMKFIASVTLMMSCLALGVIAVLLALIFPVAAVPIISIFIFGLVAGAIAYLAAKFFLFLIKVLGNIGKVIIVLILIIVFIIII